MTMYSVIPVEEEASKTLPEQQEFDGSDMAKPSPSKPVVFGSNDVMKVKSKGVNLECQICSKTYKNKKSLADHKRMYHSDKPIRLIDNKQRVKSKGVNLECQICSKTYKNKKSLAGHKRMYHSGKSIRLISNKQRVKSKGINFECKISILIYIPWANTGESKY